MAEDLGTLYWSVEADTSDIGRARSEMESLGKSADDAGSKADKFGKDTEQAGKKADDSFSKAAGAAKTLTAAMAALGVSLGVRELISYTDRWTDLNSKLVNATGSQEAANEAMAGLSVTARTTYSSLEATANSFLRNAMTMRELGYTTAQQIELSDALNNSLVIWGTKGQQAESVMNALSKAFAEGQLRGENFNSVIANGGRTVQALADGLGVGTLELRAMAEAGELTTARVINALTSQMETLREEAERMPATIGDGLLLLNNAFFETVGRMDQMLGVSGAVSGVLVEVADRISGVSDRTSEYSGVVDNLTTAVEVLSVALGTRLVIAAGAASAALASKAALMLAAIGPAGWITLAATGVYALGNALVDYSAKQKQATADLEQYIRATTILDPLKAAVMQRYEENKQALEAETRATNEATQAATEHGKKVQEIIDALHLEAEALRLSGVELEIFNALTKAGVDRASEAGQEIAALVQANYDYATSLEEARKRTEAQQKAEEELVKAREKQRQAVADLILGTRQKEAALALAGREQAIYNALVAAGPGLEHAQVMAIAESVGALYDKEKALRDAEEAAKAEQKATDDAAKAAQENWQRTHEYLSQAFVDIWNNGSNAFDNIAKSFSAMIQRMVAEWAASGLMTLLTGGGLSGFSIGGGGGGGSFGGSVVNAGVNAGINKAIGGAITGGSVSGFLSGVTGTATGIAAGTVGPPTAAAAAGAGASSALVGLAANPVTWAVIAAGLVANDFFKGKESPSGNAGLLIHDAPGAPASQKFPIEPFPSGFQPVGFARREDQGTAMQVADIYRQYDGALTQIARAAGLNVNYGNNPFGGYDENAQGNGLFLGLATEAGKQVGVSVEKQLDSFVSQWIDALGGQITSEQRDEIKSAGNADAMVQKAAQLAGLIDGSHYMGARRIPYDGYLGLLHEGESVRNRAQTAMDEAGGMPGMMGAMQMEMFNSMRRLLSIITRWDQDGLPPERLTV